MPRAEPGTAEPGSVGDQLRRLRLDREWSLGDLHQAVDRSVSVAYLSRMELGTALPRPEKLAAVASALEADVNELMRQRDKEQLVRLGIDPEVAELALTLRELESDRCREIVGELATTLRGATERSREEFLRTLTEAMDQLQGDAASWEGDRELATPR